MKGEFWLFYFDIILLIGLFYKGRPGIPGERKWKKIFFFRK